MLAKRHGLVTALLVSAVAVLTAPLGVTVLAWQLVVAVAGLTLGSLLLHLGVRQVVGGGRTAPVRLLVVGAPPGLPRALIELGAGGRDAHPMAGLRTEVLASCPPGPGVVARVGRLLAEHRPDAVMVLPDAGCDPLTIRRLTWSLDGSGTELLIGTGLPETTTTRLRRLRLGSVDTQQLRAPVVAGWRRTLKESWERLAAAAGLVMLAPLLGLLCLAVRLDSRGPALYRQRRVGRDGVPFTMLKLRTMVVEAEGRRTGLAAANECDGVLFKMRRDPRVTRLGRLLRATSLDELPQLVNVVRGEMCLVGPRPALPAEVAAYPEDMRRRLRVKPGMTGLWQVSGRSDLSWEESMRLDLYYLDNWSAGLDVAILLRTVGAVVGHRGAY